MSIKDAAGALVSLYCGQLGRMYQGARATALGGQAVSQMALEAVHLVEFELDKERVKSGVCVNGDANSEARKVLRAVGATLQAPKPPSPGERITH